MHFANGFFRWPRLNVQAACMSAAQRRNVMGSPFWIPLLLRLSACRVPFFDSESNTLSFQGLLWGRKHYDAEKQLRHIGYHLGKMLRATRAPFSEDLGVRYNWEKMFPRCARALFSHISYNTIRIFRKRFFDNNLGKMWRKMTIKNNGFGGYIFSDGRGLEYIHTSFFSTITWGRRDAKWRFLTKENDFAGYI